MNKLFNYYYYIVVIHNYIGKGGVGDVGDVFSRVDYVKTVVKELKMSAIKRLLHMLKRNNNGRKVTDDQLKQAVKSLEHRQKAKRGQEDGKKRAL